MSCNNSDQASLPSSGLLSLSGSDSAFSFSQIMEGYDYEFVPHPESRYECPICLLVLREPRQTKCGHRFCRDCIIQSLRNSSNRCPVDNEPLKESDIYPDNFAKREILNFSIKCPNTKDGCDKIFPLGKLQNHLDECPYAIMPCPNRCACIMQRIDVNYHLATSCDNRVVSCEHCHSKILAKFMQNHLAACPKAVVACPHCKEEKIRSELNCHIQSECQLVEVPCLFYRMGCGHTMLRNSVDDHLMNDCSAHMKQLCHTVSFIARKLGMTHLISEDLSKNVPETLNYMMHDVNSSSSLPTYSLTEEGSYPLNVSTDEHSLSSATGLSMMQSSDAVEHINGRKGKNVPTENGKLPTPLSSFGDGKHRITIAKHQPHEPLGASYLPFSVMSDSDIDQTLKTLSSSQTPKAKLPVRRLNHQPVYSYPSADVVSPQSESSGNLFQDQMAEAGIQTNLNVIKIIQGINSRSEEREAIHEQRFYELYNKLATVEQLNADLVNKVRDLEQRLAERDARFYYGDFYWSISKFSQYRSKLAAGENSTLHSPPFYTSPWGYKMCIRASIEKSSDAGPHLSLFVHFMQGRNDSFLSWPFSGKITICVVDQNPVPSRRMHMKETLQASPNLAAFQKPTTPKSYKGFGYIEFLSIAALENGSFLVDDTLVIRVQVFDDSR